MRLAASLVCSCVAHALVSPARDAEHIRRGRHTGRGEARDEGPEVRVGLVGVKARVSGSRKILCVA